MIDTANRRRLLVTDDKAGPFIRLPFTLVGEVQQLLESHGISHYVEENVISINGGPEMAIIDLGRNGDAKIVQAILDGDSANEASHGNGR